MVKIKLYQTKLTIFRVLSMFKKVSKRLDSSHTAPGLHKLWNPAITDWRTWKDEKHLPDNSKHFFCDSKYVIYDLKHYFLSTRSRKKIYFTASITFIATVEKFITYGLGEQDLIGQHKIREH